jgi:competence protein ComFC
LDGIIVAFIYDKLLKKLIFRIKYFHKKDIAEFLAQRLFLVIQTNKLIHYQTHVLKQKILLTYVPSHWYRKYFVKGYNQAQEIAKILAKKMDIEYVDLVTKFRHTHRQVKLNKIEREKNLNNAFDLIKWNKLTWNELVIIVDDITTTWSTLNEIAKVIKKNYPKISVRGAVLGRNDS